MSQTQDYSLEVAEVLDFVQRKIVDGIKHGHFDITISGVMGNKKQREVLVKAGMMEKFHVPADKVPA